MSRLPAMNITHAHAIAERIRYIAEKVELDTPAAMLPDLQKTLMKIAEDVEELVIH